MANPMIKFYRGATTEINALNPAPAKGSIWFNTDNNSIKVKSDNGWDTFSGYRNVSYDATNKKLVFTLADGTTKDVAITGFYTTAEFTQFEETFNNYLEAQAENNETQQASIDDSKNRIDILVGKTYSNGVVTSEGDKGKSVRTIANEELAAQLLAGPDGAVDNFKTLQELAAWLEEHPESAAAMNVTLGEHGSDIAELKENAETVNAAIETINSTIEENEEVVAAALTDLDTRVKTLEDNSITSIDGADYITVENNDGAVTVKATYGSVSGNDDKIAIASDVKSYVDSTWE